MLPWFPIKIRFDIANAPDWKDIWAHREARILALLWRPCHLVGDDFFARALQIGERIEEKKPQTEKELVLCFPTHSMSTDFPEGDVEEFARDALPFFLGDKEVEYDLLNANL